MKSRISIALGEHNQPVIKINYSHSEDVRDDLVKTFIQSFGYESNYARVEFFSTELKTVGGGIEHDKIVTITPVSDTETILENILGDEYQSFKDCRDIKEGDFIIN